MPSSETSSLTTRQVPMADVVVGGPPCQGFQPGIQGHRRSRNQFWREYLRIVGIAKAEGVRHRKRGPLSEVGFDLTSGNLTAPPYTDHATNAADFGLLQRRIRTIVIGSRVGPVELPRATHEPDLGRERYEDPDARRRPVPRAMVPGRSRPWNSTVAETRWSYRFKL